MATKAATSTTTTMTKPVPVLLLMLLLAAVSVHAKEFRVYWNIPTFQCKSFHLPAPNVTAMYGIRQNDGDNFRGNQISILYDPGLFPALLSNTSAPPGHQLFRRNGGVPQAGDLPEHLQQFERVLNELMPDHENAGIGIIDFESWRPVYRQNFGTLQPYKTLSVELQLAEHPHWPQKRAQQEAQRAFEAAGKQFMRQTLRLAERLRPRATWGYYGLPFCFNGRGKSLDRCADNIRQENDGTQWLYDASQVIYPSVYLSEAVEPAHRGRMVAGRVQEAKRLAHSGQPVIVYHRYVYTDSRRLLSEADTLAAFHAMRDTGADGVILWGASRDLNSRAQCETFYTYLAEVMGPAIVRVFGSNMHNAIEPIQEFEEFEYAVSENVDVDVDAGVDAGVDFEVDVKPENETE